MRHVTFRIGPRERDAWLARMRSSMDELRLTEEQDAMLWDYLVMAAQSLVNVPSDPAEDPLNPDGLPVTGTTP
jgi:hemoglobin